MTSPQPQLSSAIAGSVLPLVRAEELIGSLTDVVSARISAAENGSIDTIHVLVTGDTPAKAVVRNIESALMAQLGLKVDHRKISVASTARRPTPSEQAAVVAPGGARSPAGRPVYFEDVEVRGSRVRGVTCKVTLRVGAEQYVGEAVEAVQSDRSRADVSARAALMALSLVGPSGGSFVLEGAKVISVFERDFVFAAVLARTGREQVLLTGSAEIRDSVETAAVLAVLDATNRWMAALPGLGELPVKLAASV